MELKPGYKQTEVGVIPSDWEVVPLKSFAKVTSGKRLPMGYFVGPKETPYPYIRVIDMRSGWVDTNDVKYVPVEAFPPISKYRIYKEDLFISVAGTLGIVGKIPPELDGANLTENADRISDITCDRDYLLHVMLSPVVQSVIEAEQTVGAQPKLALHRIRNFSIPLPPTMQEQSAIAVALGDVDALLYGLDTRIAKQRDLKTAAMQQLLTGSTRLPGFGGKWVMQRLGDAAMLKARIGWQGLTTVEYLDTGDYFLVTGTDFSSGRIDWGNCHFVTLNRYSQDPYIQVRPRDVLVTKDGTIGKVAFVEELEKPATLNSGVFVIRPRNNSFVPEFFYFLLMSKVFAEFLEQLSAGSTINHLYQKDFVGFTYRVPPTREEQTAIAEVLTGMDAELAALEQQRAKTALLKQGMLQELLTGGARLVASNVIPFPKQETKSTERKANIHFQRSVFAAEIVERLHAEPTFGHVKFQKLIYLAERMCKVDIGANYHRDAAGPYDNQALRSIDNQLKNSKWFEARKLDGRYQYVPLEKHGGHKQYFDRYFAGVGTTFDDVIDAFKTASTEQCEIVATLYSAWDDLLKQGQPASDQAIVDQVLNHWHDAKKRIEADRWHKALDWMREMGFVPEGAASA